MLGISRPLLSPKPAVARTLLDFAFVPGADLRSLWHHRGMLNVVSTNLNVFTDFELHKVLADF